MTTEQALLTLYTEQNFDEIDMTSDTWKTFTHIMTLCPAFYKLLTSDTTHNELFILYSGTSPDDFTEVIQRLVWIFWDGNNPDGSPLGKIDWEKLGEMFSTTKGIEIKYYG